MSAWGRPLLLDFLVFALKAFDLAGCVHELLLAGEIGMAA
jgi:hypothetical protein